MTAEREHNTSPKPSSTDVPLQPQELFIHELEVFISRLPRPHPLSIGSLPERTNHDHSGAAGSSDGPSPGGVKALDNPVCPLLQAPQ